MSGSLHSCGSASARTTVAALGGAALAALLPALRTAEAIEAPKAQPTPQPPPTAQRADITPTDETQFYELLQRVTNHRSMRGLDIPDGAIDALAQGNADVAVAMLEKLANQGDRDANVALVRIQHWCGRIASSQLADPQAQIARLGGELGDNRAARAAGVIQAEVEFVTRARTGCARARFDYRNIEARLRSAAEAGDPASATELAQFVRDPAQRKALLQSAVDKNYAPAIYATATNLLIAVQRGETTENVSAIRELLKLAGRSLPKAKLDLANCMALGCDGHPADALAARAFGIDAARDGEPVAFVSMVRMPWGRRLSRVQLLAWQYFGDRLNEAGCMGDAYIRASTSFAQSIRLLEKGQGPELIEAARERAEELWRNNGERAQKENGCR